MVGTRVKVPCPKPSQLKDSNPNDYAKNNKSTDKIKMQVVPLGELLRVSEQTKNTNPSRKTLRNRRRRQRRKLALGARDGENDPYLLGIVNPFLPEVDGVRCPDSFNYPTATAVLRNAKNIDTAAGGYGTQLALPLLSDYLYVNANSTGGTVTWGGGTGNQVAQYTPIDSLASAYRVVSWGIRITAETSFSSTQGHIWVAHIPLDFAANLPYNDSPTTEAMFASMPLSEKFTLAELAQRPLIVPGRAYDDGIYRFRDIAYPANVSPYVETNPGWCGIGVYCSGAPQGTGVLNIEHIMHIEYLQDGSTLYDFVTAHPGVYQPRIMEEASKIAAGMPVAYIEESAEQFSQAAATIAGAVSNAARIGVAAGKAVSAVNSAYASITGSGRVPPLGSAGVPRITYPGWF